MKNKKQSKDPYLANENSSLFIQDQEPSHSILETYSKEKSVAA